MAGEHRDAPGGAGQGAGGVYGGTGEVGGGQYGPPPPPRPPVPPTVPPQPANGLRAAAVGLLDLSGLGLGHLLVRSWGGFVTALLATGVLLVVALPADSDGVPGALVLAYLVLLVVLALHGAAKGLRTPLTLLPSPALALGLGLVLLAVPVLATTSWDRAQQDAHHAAVERMLLGRLADADRTVATARGSSFDDSENRYREALGVYRELSHEHPDSAAAAKVPGRLRTYYEAVGEPYAKKRYCEAVTPLKYLRTVPGTIGEKQAGKLADWPEDRLATSLYACGAAGIGSAGGADEAPLAQFNELLADFPDAPQTAKVEPAVGTRIAAATKGLKGEDPCGASDSLKVLAAQAAALKGGPERVAKALDADASKARGQLATGTYACGVDAYRSKDFDTARERLAAFVSGYRSDKRVPLAKKIAIAAEVAGEEPAAGNKLPTLASGGSLTITVSNDSPDPIEVLFTGPVTGRIELAACKGCKRYDWSQTLSPAFKPCSAGRSYPERTIRVPVGTTYFLHKPAGGASVSSPGADTVRVRPGYTYTECAYVTDGLGTGGPVTGDS